MMRYRELCEQSETPVERFLDDLQLITHPHPFMRRQLILGNAVIEVRPDIDDRANGIEINDIMSLEAGKRQGHGRDALVTLLNLADKHRVKLTLFAKAYAKGPGSDKFPKTRDLVAWYKHYGFKPRHGQMERDPGTPIPPPRTPAAG